MSKGPNDFQEALELPRLPWGFLEGIVGTTATNEKAMMMVWPWLLNAT